MRVKNNKQRIAPGPATTFRKSSTESDTLVSGEMWLCGWAYAWQSEAVDG